MRALRLLLVLLSALLLASQAWAGSVSFFDDFNNGASPLWGNELGNWTAQGGGYYAQNPSNSPPTYSLLPWQLSDFTINLDVNGVSDGGVWLRSDASTQNAVLLVIGGFSHSFTGFYFHTIENGNYSGPYAEVGGLFNQGDNIHVTIVVTGNEYDVFLNGSPNPVTSFTYDVLTGGQVGLYDYTGHGYYGIDTSFDNFDLQGEASTPEPVSLTLLGGGAAIAFLRRKLTR